MFLRVDFLPKLSCLLQVSFLVVFSLPLITQVGFEQPVVGCAYAAAEETAAD